MTAFVEYEHARTGDFAAKLESGDEDNAKIVEERGFRSGRQWKFHATLKKHHETELVGVSCSCYGRNLRWIRAKYSYSLKVV